MAYNPKLVTVIVNGRFITGFRDGDIYNYEEGDRYTEYEGSDGAVDYAERPGNQCKLTIGLKHDSPSAPYLNGLLANRTPIDITIKDDNVMGKVTISGQNGVIGKRPNNSRNKNFVEITYDIMLPDHNYEDRT